MYGAILGDMIGAPYEFGRGYKTKDFPLFSANSRPTDDTVMTIAVAEALMDTPAGAPEEEIMDAIVHALRRWGRAYPDAGYGGGFRRWLRSAHPKPYGSYGNGAAMRVSAVGWLYETLEETRRIARLTAAVTHNHPEGIKGAEATASAIFLARSGRRKGEIADYIRQEFAYDLSRTCDEIRPQYHHMESCQETVPEALTAFFEGESFEDVIRTAVSLGGDCDTLTCIAGGVAEAFYGVPEEMVAACRARLPEEMLAVLDRFETVKQAAIPAFRDVFLDGNELIEAAIDVYHAEPTEEHLQAVLETIRTRMHQDGHFMIPVADTDDSGQFALHTLPAADGQVWLVAYTTQRAYEQGAPSGILSHFIEPTMRLCLDDGPLGFILNPWSQDFQLTREMVERILAADGGVEYSVPEDDPTPELLADGTFLKRAIGICRRNDTNLNRVKLVNILRTSEVWVPCRAILSEADYDAMAQLVAQAQQEGNLDSLVGKSVSNQDNIRMVPEILETDNGCFFPVFATEADMDEFGEGVSKLAMPFVQAVQLAKHNKKDPVGMVLNPFTEPYILSRELFDLLLASPED